MGRLLRVSRRQVTTNASGYATTDHACDEIPYSIHAWGTQTGGPTAVWQANTDSYDATNFRVRCLNSSGTPLANALVEIYFVAFAAE